MDRVRLAMAIVINSNGCTVYKQHVLTNRTTVAGREKGLIIFENYCIQKKMVGGIGMHKRSIIPEKRRARVLIPPGYLHLGKISH
jgi:hypothetical protein